ncbi:MAG: hypothetical protein GSR86_00230 [Desulfurococcales archaeon]|nr:hypothetical protein [Desulfurococcales archaeon]
MDSYRLQARAPLVLARSRRLLVSTVVDGGPMEPGIVDDAYRVLQGGEPPGDVLRASMVYALLYGGIVLVYSHGVTTPISRIYSPVSIQLVEAGPEPAMVDDLEVLDVWAHVYAGRVEALRRLEGGLHAPRGYSWRLGPGLRVAPTGFKPVLSDE